MQLFDHQIHRDSAVESGEIIDTDVFYQNNVNISVDEE